MHLKEKSLEQLKQIINQDYGIILSNIEAGQCGSLLLKVTRLAIGAFNRAEGKRSLAININ